MIASSRRDSSAARLRVVWLNYDFEEYSLPQVAALSQHHDVMMITPESERAMSELSGQTRLLSFDKPRMRQPLRQWQSIGKLKKEIESFAPDVIHFQQGHLWFNFALPWIRRRWPLVLTVHDPRHHSGDRDSRKTPQWVMDYGFRQADQIIVHGSELARQAASISGLAPEHVHVIPHVAMGGDSSSDSAVAEEEQTILFFGRIWEYKGLETLIRAEPIIGEQLPSVRIVIAGVGDDFSRYEQMMENPARFETHPRWISDSERANFFDRAALVVLPYHEATQSGVVPVAYARGKPVVATDVGALSDCVLNGETGLLVPPRDPTALAHAIVTLLKDAPRRKAMGAAAKRYLEQTASPEAVASATETVYRRAIEYRVNGGDR